MKTDSPEFHKSKNQQKIKSIERNAYSLMIKYIVGQIEIDEFHDELSQLSILGFHKKDNLIIFVQERINYEAYHFLAGKTEEQRTEIRKRVNYFKNLKS